MTPHVDTGATDLRPLARLRARLTIWYAATFGVLVLLLAGGMFLVVRGQFSRQLNRSLEEATRELMGAARVRAIERQSVKGPVVDAIDELRIPDRQLYLIDTAGVPVRPATAPDWVRQSARDASSHGGVYHFEGEKEDGHWIRAHARRFRLPSGDVFVAVAAVEAVELEDRYAELIATFSVAAMLAVALIGGGGWLLARRATEPIERSVRRMRQFMADAAHELRTPITVLRARAEVALQQERTSEQYTSALRAIESESARLGGIVESLLLLARADSGELPIRRDHIYLDDVALEAAQAARPMAQRKGIELRIPTFEEAPVEADSVLLRQLVIILLDNAIKFTPSGGEVTVRVHAGDAGAELSVSDSGEGIPPEKLPHVFERFFRGDAARGRSDGAGLGLSIAKWIVDEHRGQIAIASVPGSGSTATVRLPVARSSRDNGS